MAAGGRRQCADAMCGWRQGRQRGWARPRRGSPCVSAGRTTRPTRWPAADGEPEGLDLRLTNAVLRQAGLAARWQLMPWARQLLSLQDGSLDLMVSASQLPEREAFALWTEPYRPKLGALLALRAPAKPLRHLRELASQPVRIGMIRGTAYPGEFAEAQRSAGFARRLVPLRNLEQGLELLRKGKLDYLIEDPVALQYLVAQQHQPPLAVARWTYRGESRLMLAKRSEQAQPGLLAKLNAAITSLRDSGELRRLVADTVGFDA